MGPLASFLFLLAFGAFVSPAAHAQTITLTPSSGIFDSTFTAAGTGYSGNEPAPLYLLANPASAPANCTAIISSGSGVQLGSASANAGGAVTHSDVSVSSSFVAGSENYLCLYGQFSGNESPVVQFEVLTPTISLSSSSGPFGSTFTATGANFSGSESVSLHLLSNPSSAPSDCTAIRDDSNSINLGSANASSGSVSVSSVSVTSARFTTGNQNYMCLHGATSSTSSPVTQFTVSIPTGTVSLSPSSGDFGSSFTASGTSFSGSESVSLHLLSNPSSAPADCSAIRNDSNSVNLGSANASSGSVSVSNVSVTSARFTAGDGNYLCLYGNTSTGSSPVTQFTVTLSPTIALAPSGGDFGTTLTATGANFSGSERVSLHLLAGPASRPASCNALRNASGSVSLGSANASAGSVSIRNVAVSEDRFVGGDGNYLCLHGAASATSSAVVRFTVSTSMFLASPQTLELRKNTSTTFTLKLGAAPSKPTTWLIRTNPDVAALRAGPHDPNNPPAKGHEPELTFTPSDWNLPRTVTVTGVGEGTARISSVFAYGDWDYRRVALNIPVTVPPPNAFVLPRTYLALKAGEQRSFSVRLETQPPAGAHGVWKLKSDLDVGIEPAVVGFNRDNWNEPRHIVVTGGSAGRGRVYTEWVGRAGDDLEGVEPFAVRLAVSAGKAFAVSLWNGADRDGVIRLWEGGASGGFSVALTEQPTGTVTVQATATSTEGLAHPHIHPHVLTFTRANWSRRQAVSLAPADDEDADDEIIHVHLQARGGGYDRATGEIAACVDDDSDADETCAYTDEPRGPEDKRPIEGPGLSPVGAPIADTPVRAPRSGAGDTAAPRLVAWQRHSPASATTDADVLTWRLTFTEPVRGVTASHFTVRLDGSASHAARHGVRGSGTTWDVTVSGGGLADLNGTVALGFRTTRGITDRAGNALTNTTPLSGARETTYTLKNAAPARFSKGDAALSRLSRSIGLGAIGVVTGRAGAAGGSSLTLAGRTIPLGGAGALAALDNGTPGNMGSTARRRPHFGQSRRECPPAGRRAGSERPDRRRPGYRHHDRLAPGPALRVRLRRWGHPRVGPGGRAPGRRDDQSLPGDGAPLRGRVTRGRSPVLQRERGEFRAGRLGGYGLTAVECLSVSAVHPGPGHGGVEPGGRGQGYRRVHGCPRSGHHGAVNGDAGVRESACVPGGHRVGLGPGRLRRRVHGTVNDAGDRGVTGAGGPGESAAHGGDPGAAPGGGRLDSAGGPRAAA